jgi:hypothetical protein
MKKKKILKAMKSYLFKIVVLLLVSPIANAFEIRDFERKKKNNYNITTIVDKISRDAIERNLRNFVASGRPSRFIGSIGHQKARDFIKEKLKAANSMGASFTLQEFTPNISRIGKPLIKGVDFEKGQKGYNLIWEKKGSSKPDEVIVLGANYDTLLLDSKTMMVQTKGEMPGADNNGTGVAALLSMIEIFDKLDLPKSIRIVFFDF